MEKVASLSQLPADRGLCVEIKGQKILLARDGANVRAFSAVCPHAGAPLEEGAICNGHIICPWHKGMFRLSDGALVEPPPLDPLTRYPVRVEGDDIFVGGEPETSAPPPLKKDERTFVIVGAGAAGATAVAALREFGFGGRILLVGQEAGAPYDRTSLSKFVVSGDMKPQDTPLLRPDSFYEEQKIERVHAEVNQLDAGRREIALSDGRVIPFDQALIASGAKPIAIDIPGSSLSGVHALRTREDAAAILADIRPGAKAVVLGSSFIGLEVASSLRAQKVEVTIVSPEEVPFARQFGQRIGASIRDLHKANGVAFEAPAKAARIEGDQRVSSVLLEDGRRLAADCVIVGIGVRPATDFVKGVSTTKDGGLRTTATLRVAEGVYAAGDIAAFAAPSDGNPIRIEHWSVAQIQGRVAAMNMLGAQVVYDTPPFFWTSHYGKNFEYLGHVEHWDNEIVVGDVENGKFAAFLLRGDRVGAVVACEREQLTCQLIERMRRPLLRDEALRMANAAT